MAGSDPTGGAGLQADLKTFAAHEVYGASVVTALTAQNAHRFEVLITPAAFLAAQTEAVFETFDIRAIKVGMLGNEQSVQAVIAALQRHNAGREISVVLDPVIRAGNGGEALDRQGIVLLREQLFPLVTLIKPNIHEAALLLGEQQAGCVEQMSEQARKLEKSGGAAVLLSGGHLTGNEAVDILCKGGEISIFRNKKFPSLDVHGTGCTLTSAITANLARGASLHEAIGLAKTYLTRLMEIQQQLDLTGSPRSLDHLA